MTLQEGLGVSRGPGVGAAGARRLHDQAYFLGLLGDSHNGLGRYEAAIEAYRQAAEGFRDQGAQCSYALCLLKIADSYLSLDEPWHAVGYLEACLPLLKDLGLTRHEAHAQDQLARCRAGLAQERLLGDGRAGRRRTDRGRPARPARDLSPRIAGVDS
jgi:tetratricopeptide (TPR) repeat protein